MEDSKASAVEKPFVAQPAPVAVLVEPNQVLELPSIEVDLLLQRSATLVGQRKWQWYQAKLQGQRLDLLQYDELVDRFYTQHCEIVQHFGGGESTYEFHEHGETKFLMFFASPTRRDFFLTAFHASTTNEYWTRPTSSVLDDMIAVACSIVETEQAEFPSSIGKPQFQLVTEANADIIMAFLDSLNDFCQGFPLVESPVELYEQVLALEAEYAADPANPKGIVAEVLKLYGDVSSKWTLRLDCSQCPHCEKPLQKESSMMLHVGGKALVCDQCNNTVSYETFKLGEMIRELKSLDFKTGVPLFKKEQSMPLSSIPRDGRAQSYMKALWRRMVEKEISIQSRIPKNAIFDLEERIMDIMNRIDLVQVIYRHLLVSCQICAHLEYWRHPKVLQASIIRYSKFAHLQRLPKSPPLLPTLDIWLVALSLRASNKGPLLLDLGFENQSIRLGDTAFLWGEKYEEAYSSCKMDMETWVKSKPGNEEVQHRALRKQWAKFCRLPSKDCRFVGVEETYPSECLIHASQLELNYSPIALSVIGAHDSDKNISRGKLRSALPSSAGRVYTYQYAREVRGMLEKVLSPNW